MSQPLKQEAERSADYYGSPLTPVLALPSVEEVERVVWETYDSIEDGRTWVSHVARAVLDLIRNAQPAAAREWAAIPNAERDVIIRHLRLKSCHEAADLLAACDGAQPGAKGGA